MSHAKRPAFRASQHGYLADGLAFDERAYLQAHPDVGDVVARGVLSSGLQHYQCYGRWEGREFPVRSGLIGAFALFLGWCEALLRVVWSKLDPWDLTPELRADGVHPRLPLAGPRGMRNFRAGPWRSPLPWHSSGYAVLELSSEGPGESTCWVVRLLTIDGAEVGEPQTLDCRSNRSSKRVLHLPAEARQLELRQQNDQVAWIGRLRLKPLPSAAATRMIRRRLSRPELGVAPAAADAQASRPNAALWRAYQNTFPLVARPTYDWWLQRVEGPRIRAIEAAVASRVAQLPERLQFSLLVPVFNPDPIHLRACLDSMLDQSYPHWEACLVDDASTNSDVHRVLREYATRDARFRTLFRKRNGHISRTSQDALEMARAEFVVLVDHDDVLARHALLLMAEKLREHPDAVLVYSDEDKLDDAGNRCDPHFKPDFDPDRLLGHNYIAHLLVARRSEVLERGGFRVGFEGSQDHDLVLRLVAKRTADVVLHVPEVLYHWRKHERSTASQLASKPYALEAGRRAVVSYLEQLRLDARVEFDEPGQSLRVRWALPPAPPRVSIIVPTRDGQPHLSRCIRTLLDFADYSDFEILIVDNGSRDEQTLRYLEHAEEDEHVVVWRDDRPFNFSQLNNFAVTKATGRVLAFVNDDIQATEPGWLHEMVSLAIRPDIGAVGAKLLYPDGRIQHGGVVLGIGGIAGHAFKFSSGRGTGYFSKLRMTHTVSAVTAACMVIERRKFQQVGRFDEEKLQVAFNDVDLCLRLRQAGFRNLLAPHAVLIHQESASRGSDETAFNRERFAREQLVMRERWQQKLVADPYYSPNLSNEFEDFSLRAN